MNAFKHLVIKTALTLLAPSIVHVTMDMCWMRMVGVVMVCTRVDDYQSLLLYILCIDIDECLSGPCPSDLICRNTVGNFSCDCPDGTINNGTDCICK